MAGSCETTVVAGYVGSNIAAPSVSFPFSFSFWCRLLSAYDNKNIACATDKDTSNQDGWWIESRDNNTWRLSTRNGGTLNTITGGTRLINTWQNIVLVCTSATERRIYVDKSSAGGTGQPSWTLQNIDALSFNGYFNGGGRSSAGALARFAHPAFWSIALSQTDVNNLYVNTPNLVQPGSLVHRWTLEDVVASTGENDLVGSYNLGQQSNISDSSDAPVFPTGATFYTSQPAPHNPVSRHVIVQAI